MLSCHHFKNRGMYTVGGLNQFLFQGLPFFQLLVRHVEAYIYIVRLLSLVSNNRDR